MLISLGLSNILLAKSLLPLTLICKDAVDGKADGNFFYEEWIFPGKITIAVEFSRTTQS